MIQQVVYLCHRISKEGLEPTDNEVRAVRGFPTPHNVAIFIGWMECLIRFKVLQ